MTGFILLILICGIAYVVYKLSIDSTPTSGRGLTTTVTYSENRNTFKPTPENIEILKALLFLGRADGKLMPKELNIMIDYLVRSQPEHKGSDEWFLSERIKELTPYNEAEYLQFVENLNTDSKKKLLTWLEAIFGTQTKNHPYEDRLLNDLHRAIAQ